MEWRWRDCFISGWLTIIHDKTSRIHKKKKYIYTSNRSEFHAFVPRGCFMKYFQVINMNLLLQQAHYICQTNIRTTLKCGGEIEGFQWVAHSIDENNHDHN